MDKHDEELEEAGLLMEDIIGKPVSPKNAQDGIAAMQSRLEYLRKQLKQLISQLEEAADDASRAAIEKHVDECRRETKLAEERINDYTRQTKSLN